MTATFAARVSRAVLVWATLAIAVNLSQAQTNGIFAEFNTSMGSFTCRVEYAKAPKAAANFIGLATGQRRWLDATTGVVKAQRFYDGQIFHRVIAGFIIQSGSSSGTGMDGPGYTFQDEFDPSLRHDGFGVLSMANSGADGNGSQFFVTVAARPDLDDRYTAFGRLVGGSNVVYAINNVATDAADRPVTDVSLLSVIIRRVGAEAQVFDIHAQGLPIVNGLPTALQTVGSSLALFFSNSLGMDTRVFNSSDLRVWTEYKLGIETDVPVVGAVGVNSTAPQKFFRMAQIDYPDTLHVPESVANRLITLNFSALFGTIAIQPDGLGGGTYSQNSGPSGPISYTWLQTAYRGRFVPVSYGGAYHMKLDLDFDSPTNGTFKGTLLPNYPSAAGSGPVSGSFTASP